jgi:2-polyprenyl-3-methyl-5-hydroxy-6-metoxy-1,4-benzoquinol methylase
MAAFKCNVCQSPLNLKIYDSGDSLSLTSLCTTHLGKTEVYACSCCTHAQSVAIQQIDEFYDKDYNILVNSEEEDQVYKATKGNVVYRTDHQVRTMLERLELKPGTRILDYGCAKSGTMRVLSTKLPDLDIFLFDVSERYRPFWKKFIPRENTATYSIPPNWNTSFDLVTSLFSLEHIDRPSVSLSDINHLLKDDGILYGIVPSFEANIADLIVVDHVNHFTRQSLSFALYQSGFEILEISDTAHKGAFVFRARKARIKDESASAPCDITSKSIDAACKIGAFWQKAGTRIQDFERELPPNAVVALYGGGFYGTFIVSWLSHPERIQYIIDQNVFLHGRKIHGVPVIRPDELPRDVNTIFVGLNPNSAKQILQDINSFKDRDFLYFLI